LIYQQETLEAVKKVLENYRGHARKEVKRFNKIRGKELIEFRGKRFTIDDYYAQQESIEWELSRMIEEINTLTKDSTHSQIHAVQLMKDAEVLSVIIKEKFPGTIKTAEGMTSPALAAAIIDQLGSEVANDGEEKETG